ncbi:MAG: signal peptidase II [Nitrospira sp.]|nr:signal peptidase II [Nitrospira sp.]
MNKYLLLTVVAGVVIVFDQASKYAVQNMMAIHDYMEIIPGFFNVTYVQNPGAAFGIFGRTTGISRFVLLVGISLFALAMLLIMYEKTTGKFTLTHLAIAMIIGGAVGNLIDRIRLHWVMDFLDFYWNGNHWPSFNIADSAITIGTLILMFNILFSRNRNIINV